MYQLF